MHLVSRGLINIYTSSDFATVKAPTPAEPSSSLPSPSESLRYCEVISSSQSRIIWPNTSSCSKSLSCSIVSANITTWQYTTMRDGLVANIDLITTRNHMHMSNGLVDYRGYVLTTPSPLMSKLYRNYRGYVLTTPPLMSKSMNNMKICKWLLNFYASFIWRSIIQYNYVRDMRHWTLSRIISDESSYLSGDTLRTASRMPVWRANQVFISLKIKVIGVMF